MSEPCVCETAKNMLGWVLSFQAQARAWKLDLPDTVQRALDDFKQDTAAGVKKYMQYDCWGNRDTEIYTLYLQDLGYEVHFACSDEYFGYEAAYMKVYNLLSGAPSKDGWYFLVRGNEWHDPRPEELQRYQRLTQHYDTVCRPEAARRSNTVDTSVEPATIVANEETNDGPS